MKVVGTLLAILVILMPGPPLFAGISCMDKAENISGCCGKKMKRCHLNMPAKNKQSPNKCDKKNCPFEVCNCCYYTKINRPFLEIPYILLPAQKKILVKENIISRFISDCWHPPEFI